MTQTTNHTPRKLLALIGSLVVVLAVVNIFASNGISTSGQKLKMLEKEKSLLEEENWQLEVAITEKQSLNHLSQEAEKLKLAPIQQVVNLTLTPPLAQLP
jgi:hypothetical protein